MIMKVYSMLDATAKAYGAPLAFVSDAVAERTAKALLMQNDSDMAKFPEDYSLWCIGEFSSETGVMTPQAPVLVFQLSSLKPRVE